MALTVADVRRLLAQHQLRPSRALGQHFVVDPNTVRKIVRLSGATSDHHVVEVGAGLGALTLELAATGAHVVAVEIDRRLVPILRQQVVCRGTHAGSVDVVEADALRLSWPDLLSGAPRWRMVGNLPYNVATPLVVRALELAPQLSDVLVMVQREVGERLAAGPGDQAYGAVSVKVAYWGRAAVVGRVPPTVFHPPPRVESVLVRIERRSAVAVDPGSVSYKVLCGLVGAGFAQRRKMLRSSLRGQVDADAFASSGIRPQARAEELSVEEWGRLAAAVRGTARSEETCT